MRGHIQIPSWYYFDGPTRRLFTVRNHIRNSKYPHNLHILPVRSLNRLGDICSERHNFYDSIHRLPDSTPYSV